VTQDVNTDLITVTVIPELETFSMLLGLSSTLLLFISRRRA